MGLSANRAFTKAQWRAPTFFHETIYPLNRSAKVKLCRMQATVLRHGPFLCGYEAGCGLNQEVSSRSLGHAIAPHLPYLRHYRRPSSGSRPSGCRPVPRVAVSLVSVPGAAEPANGRGWGGEMAG